MVTSALNKINFGRSTFFHNQYSLQRNLAIWVQWVPISESSICSSPIPRGNSCNSVKHIRILSLFKGCPVMRAILFRSAILNDSGSWYATIMSSPCLPSEYLLELIPLGAGCSPIHFKVILIWCIWVECFVHPIRSSVYIFNDVILLFFSSLHQFQAYWRSDFHTACHWRSIHSGCGRWLWVITSRALSVVTRSSFAPWG